MKPAVSGALRVAALAAVAVFASAFAWKPKPTAELKADLVAYARGAGETKFADAVEKTTSTAEWMRLALKHGAELLKASEGGDFNDKKRERGLRIIDYPLHVDNYDPKRSTLEDKRTFIEVIREYCAGARDRDDAMSDARAAFDWDRQFEICLDPKRAKERWLKTRAFTDEAHGDDHCSMCGKQFCAVRTSRRIKKLAAEL